MIGGQEVLERFHRTLVGEIAAKRPEYLHGPFTVAEIYQDLVPYGTHRDDIGVDMNGDYEHALVRILSGEGGFLILESEPALRALREELKSSNPDTSIYREFAAVDVRLNPAAASASTDAWRNGGAAGHAVEEPPIEDLVPVGDLAPSDGSASSEPAAAPASTTCPWCRADLPQRASLRYCPFCGTDVNVVPCPGCGEELEPDWRFCIACGTEVGG
ncbi:MAG TPA: zinc ribbon domain-containing protein [Longimicrobiales bacterium]|nr:zinc ribbon domain-containing protein [Longimicrobiales bacterium]